jgi:CheY-like chemotaxis protein
MPVMDGYETIAALKAQWPDIKIIAFSITNSRREEERAIEAGAHAFVSKLCSIVELQKVLHDMQEPAGSDC